MASVGKLDFRGYVQERKKRRAGGGRGGGHHYAYVSDKTTRLAFERLKPVELAISAAVRLFKEVGRNELLGSSVKVGPRQFPRVHELATGCAETLGIPTPTLYVVNRFSLNAATYGTNEDSFILLHSALIDHLSDDELRSVIGHECGHIHNSHVVYLTAMHYLRVMASVFVRWAVTPAMLALQAWSRRAEITCDRASLLCTRDLDVSTRALAKLALGSTKLYEQLDLEVFLEQYEESRNGVGRLAEAWAAHPWLPKRVKALRLFAESRLYRGQLDQSGGLTMEQVDDRVHEIIRVVG